MTAICSAATCELAVSGGDPVLMPRFPFEWSELDERILHDGNSHANISAVVLPSSSFHHAQEEYVSELYLPPNLLEDVLVNSDLVTVRRVCGYTNLLSDIWQGSSLWVSLFRKERCRFSHAKDTVKNRKTAVTSKLRQRNSSILHVQMLNIKPSKITVYGFFSFDDNVCSILCRHLKKNVIIVRTISTDVHENPIMCSQFRKNFPVKRNKLSFYPVMMKGVQREETTLKLPPQSVIIGSSNTLLLYTDERRENIYTFCWCGANFGRVSEVVVDEKCSEFVSRIAVTGGTKGGDSAGIFFSNPEGDRCFLVNDVGDGSHELYFYRLLDSQWKIHKSTKNVHCTHPDTGTMIESVKVFWRAEPSVMLVMRDVVTKRHTGYHMWISALGCWNSRIKVETSARHTYLYDFLEDTDKVRPLVDKTGFAHQNFKCGDRVFSWSPSRGSLSVTKTENLEVKHTSGDGEYLVVDKHASKTFLISQSMLGKRSKQPVISFSDDRKVLFQNTMHEWCIAWTDHPVDS